MAPPSPPTSMQRTERRPVKGIHYYKVRARFHIYIHPNPTQEHTPYMNKLHVYKCVYVHMHAHAYTYTHIHITHTHVHTYTHTHSIHAPHLFQWTGHVLSKKPNKSE